MQITHQIQSNWSESIYIKLVLITDVKFYKENFIIQSEQKRKREREKKKHITDRYLSFFLLFEVEYRPWLHTHTDTRV